ncbi:MAG: phosphate transport system permease protein [Planctomycetota bacterium]|jgi:phosphate transport system permease protein
MSWHQSHPSNLVARRRKAFFFRSLCTAFTWSCFILLAFLLFHVGHKGIGLVNWDFLTNSPSWRASESGIWPALAGSFYLMGLTALISIPVGVGAALYLQEFAVHSRFSKTIDVNISNLAGVPSIVYGILGATVFVRFLALKQSVLAGALTMTLLILPVIIIASREAIKSVPQSIRHAALALGATKWQTVVHHVVPAATPGILTGVILALSRAIGETAPLITIGAVAYISDAPAGIMDSFTVMPLQIYSWTTKAQAEFQDLAAAGIVTLLTFLVVMNAVAVWIRHRSERNQQC